MRRPILAAVAAAVLIPGAALLPAASASAAGDPILPLSQVHSGMRCTGYSVVRGTDIASFDVEVLDVVDADPNEDGPRILVQVSGPAVDATGVGPGFSGSPIYCRDAAGVARNIGAISESVGEFGNKVALATPIEAILSATPRAPHGKPVRSGTIRAAAASRAGASSRRVVASSGSARRAGQGSASGPEGAPAPGLDGSLRTRTARAERRLRREGSRPLSGPLTVAGLSPALGRALEAAGRKAGRPVLAAPAGPLGSFPRQQLRPGSAVAVGYSTGDVRLGAIGTVAYTDGDAVWAFGHPFEAAGARSLLLQDAYVYHVVNDPIGLNGGSYKLSAPGHTLGTLTNDALDAVVGRVGLTPRTIPMRVRAHDDDTGRVSTVRVRAASETDVGDPTGASPLSQVAPIAVLQGATNVLGAAPGRLSGTMCVRLSFVETDRVAHFCNRYVSSSSGFDFGLGGNNVALSGAFDVYDALGLVDGFEGPPPHVSRLNVTVHESRGERRAVLRGVKAPKTVRPGHRIRLKLQLQRVRSTAFAKTVTVKLPRRLPPGRHKLEVYGGGSSDFGGSDGDIIELLFGEDTPSTGPATLKKLIHAIDRYGRYDGLEARVADRHFRVYRDKRMLITGHTSVKVRVAGRRSHRKAKANAKRPTAGEPTFGSPGA